MNDRIIMWPMVCILFELLDGHHRGKVVYNPDTQRIIMVEGDISKEFLYTDVKWLVKKLLTHGWTIIDKMEVII